MDEVEEDDNPDLILHSYKPDQGIIDRRIWQAGCGSTVPNRRTRAENTRCCSPAQGTKVFHTSELTSLESDGDTWKTAPVIDISERLSIPWTAQVIAAGVNMLDRDVKDFGAKHCTRGLVSLLVTGTIFFLWDVSIEVPAVDGRDYRFAIPQGLMK